MCSKDEYNDRVADFLRKTNAKVKIEFMKKGVAPLWHDNVWRNVYKVTIKRNGKQFSYRFYDSVYNTKNNVFPDEYDVLSCLEKYEVGDLDDFCSLFCYDMFDENGRVNKETVKIYNAVVREIKGVQRIFGDVIDEFAEICS